MQLPPFDMWKDYFNLSQVVLALIQSGGQRPEAQGNGEPKPGSLLGQEQGLGGLGASRGLATLCNFCKHNGESRHVYSSHQLKTPEGVVVCPILRHYVCPLCGATGGQAHTLNSPSIKSWGREGTRCRGGKHLVFQGLSRSEEPWGTLTPFNSP
uniref:Nanos C2HC-type zinc finger 2 n=1 Tax=Ursus maritimus TaxID=29073 RepID=A0A452VGS7_URSMA